MGEGKQDSASIGYILLFDSFLKIKLLDHRLGKNHGSIYVDLSKTPGKNIHAIFKDKMEKEPENDSPHVFYWLRQRQEKQAPPRPPCSQGTGEVLVIKADNSDS